MVAKALKVQNGSVEAKNGPFSQLCLDILASESTRVGSKAQTARVKEVVNRLIDRYCLREPEHVARTKGKRAQAR
jgi:hypothetical protein